MSIPARIALAQTDAVLGDVEVNLANHAALTRRAIEQGADAIVFPELSLTGYTLRDLNFDVAFGRKDPKLEELLELSRSITIVCGAVESDERGAVYNAAFVLEAGKVLHVHRKIYPPTYGLFEEMRYFSRGDRLVSFESARLGTCGVLVCEDLWHPVLPYLLSQQGAQIVITIAASPTRLDTGRDALASDEIDNFRLNYEHHAAYARLLGVYTVFVNRVGVEDGVNFWGGSTIVAPSGELVTRCSTLSEDLQIGLIEAELVAQSRRLSRHALDEDFTLTRQLFEDTYRLSRPRPDLS